MRLLKPVYLPMLFISTFAKHLTPYHIMNCSVNYTLLKFLVNCGDGSMSTYLQDSSMCRSIIKYRTFFLFVRVFPKAVSWDHFFLLCMSITYPIISTIVLHTSLLMMLRKCIKTIDQPSDCTLTQADLTSFSKWSDKWKLLYTYLMAVNAAL